MSHTDGCFKLHIWNQLIRLAAMQQQSVFCDTCVVDVLSSFNASANLAAYGGHVCASPPIAYLNFTSQSLHLPSSGLNNEVVTPHLLQNAANSVDLYGQPELLQTLSLLLHCSYVQALFPPSSLYYCPEIFG